MAHLPRKYERPRIIKANVSDIPAFFVNVSYNKDISGSEDFSVVLEKETLLEVGNILIGASVSKVAELLNDNVSYRPPRIVIESKPGDIVDWDLAEPDGPVILLQTVFSFDKRVISGLLFLIPSYKSFEWLKKALHAFI